MTDPQQLEKAFEELGRNAHWLGLQFLFGGDAGYRRASAFMEQNRKLAEARRNEG